MNRLPQLTVGFNETPASHETDCRESGEIKPTTNPFYHAACKAACEQGGGEQFLEQAEAVAYDYMSQLEYAPDTMPHGNAIESGSNMPFFDFVRACWNANRFSPPGVRTKIVLSHTKRMALHAIQVATQEMNLAGKGDVISIRITADRGTTTSVIRNRLDTKSN